MRIKRLFPMVFLAAAVAIPMAGCPKKRSFDPVPDGRGFGEFTVRQNPGAGWNTRSVVLGDVDGDGDLDAFVANYGEQNRLLFNDGSGEFIDGTDVESAQPTGLPQVQDNSNCAVFGDLDGDGDLDIVVGNNGQNLLLINDGNGEFDNGTDIPGVESTGFPTGTEDTRAVGLANIDAEGGFDSDLDLILVNNGQNRLYLNDGNAEFLDGTDLPGVFTTGFPMDSDAGRGLLIFNADADVSSDSDLDLLILNEGSPIRLYINSTGFGEFVDSTFETKNSAASIPPLTGVFRDGAAANLDGDALSLTDVCIAAMGRNPILLNRGAGFYTDATSYWQRERVWMNGPLHAIHGTPPVSISIYTVGQTVEGSPMQPTGAVRQSPGNGSWNSYASGLTPSTLLAVWSDPTTAEAYAAGMGGVVLTNRNTVPAWSWADLSQSLTTVDLGAATGVTASEAYFGGGKGTILKYDGTNFSVEREFTNTDLTAVWGAGPGAVFLGGSLGEILYGEFTGGFAPQSSGTSVQVSGIWGDSATNVYAVGTGGTILHFWDQSGTQPLAWYAETSPTFLSFTDVTGRAGEIWAVGDFDATANEFTIIKDTGSGWVAAPPGLGFGENLSATWMDAVVTGDVFAVGENGAVIRWDATGTSWINYTPAVAVTTHFSDIDGTGTGNVLIVGNQGTLFHFDGSSWTSHPAPVTTVDLTGVWMEDTTNAWVIGTFGALYHLNLTTWTWTAVSPALTTRSLLAVWGSSANDVYAVGEGGILIHNDGSAWSVVESGEIAALFALDSTHVYAVGPSGLILMGDGAGNWSAFANVPTTEDLSAVWAGNSTNVVAVGKGGTILHYNGSWSTQGVPTTVDLYAVWGVSPVGPVLAAGDQGVILEDSGLGWDDSSVVPYLWAGTTDRITGLWSSSAGDLYACTLSGCLFHYTGGSPTAGFVTPSNADTHAVRILDLDAGSFPDLLFANSGQDRAWTNNGFGLFNDVTASTLPTETGDSWDFALGGLFNPGSGWTTKTSLDGDTDADLIVGNVGGQNRLILNNGSGVYTDGTDIPGVTATGLPAAVRSRGVSLGDVDGDGLADAVIARFGTQNRLLLNKGGGRFEDATSSATAGLPVDTDPTVAVILVDVDDDGDLDVIFANDSAAQELLVNDGKGLFTTPSPLILPADVFAATSVAVGDLDQDLVPDIVFGTASGQNRLYIQNAGAYTDATAVSLPVDSDDTRAVALIDVDGDGAKDIVFANSGAQNRLHINNLAGTGLFEDGTFGLTTHLPSDTDSTLAIVFGDVTGNGNADIVFINHGSQDILAINNGTGYFNDGTDLGWIAATGLPAGMSDGTCGLLVDVDHDGDLDLIVGNDGRQNRLFLNDGAGEFTDGTDEVQAAANGLPVALAQTKAMAQADLDLDGDPDLFFANEGADEVLMNR